MTSFVEDVKKVMFSRIMFLVPILILMSYSSTLAENGTIQDKLFTTYSRDNNICDKIFVLYNQHNSCWLNDEKCFVFDWAPSNELEIIKLGFEELATNQYGYTQIYISESKFNEKGMTILYLNNFQGDKHPRLLETWKVDTSKLKEILLIPPGPMPYEKWIKNIQAVDKNANSVMFSELLKSGEKLTNEWSPVFRIEGDAYVIERECRGSWQFGGYYNCGTIIKLTAKRIRGDGKSVPYCQFTRKKRKR